MFIKVTRSGPRRYVQLVEALRDEKGRPRQRTVATLGRLDQLDTGLESVISGLIRVTGKAAPEAATPTAIAFEPARDFGDVWALSELWNDLGFDRLRKVFGRTRHSIDVEALIRVMVFNRLCDPESKLGILRWLEGSLVPDVAAEAVTHQHLLRTMDTLDVCVEQMESALSGLLRPLIDQELSIVFYDLTTIRAEGRTELEGEVRQFGLSREGGIVRQVMQTYRVVRVAMDQTGMGEKPVEDAKRRHGTLRVEGVLFSPARKLDMATALKERMQDRKLRLPQGDTALRADLHAIKKQVGTTGVPRLVADGETDGHADRFWALALACAAGAEGHQPIEFQALGRPRDSSRMNDYMGS